MRERPAVPFAFLADLLDLAQERDERYERDEPRTRDAHARARTADPTVAGAKAAVLDATADVLAAVGRLLQATEDMVRLRRDRLVDASGSDEPLDEREPDAAPQRPQRPPGRERVDLTY